MNFQPFLKGHCDRIFKTMNSIINKRGFIVHFGELILFTNIPIRSTSGHELEIGDNYFPNDEYNKTEKVILKSFEDFHGRRAFKIIHSTPILNKRGSIVDIRIHTKLEKKNGILSDLVIFYLTSRENSPGFIDMTWKDGKPLQIVMKKDTFVRYNLQPQMTRYLEQMDKCHKEAYYECIASQLDISEFSECNKKCMPNVLSYLGNKFSTSFCDNDTASQKCIFDQMRKQDVGFNCKKSCSILEYLGEVVLNIPYQSEHENWDIYWLEFKLTNQDFLAVVWEEYLIYDVIGMIGSVYLFSLSLNKNFTFIKVLLILGMFIGFSLIGFVSWICSYLKKFTESPTKLPE